MREMDLDSVSARACVLLLVSALTTLLLINIIASVVSVFGVPEYIIVILLIPVLEETAKLFARRTSRNFVAAFIIAYASVELALVKLPIVLAANDEHTLMITFYAILAFLFHCSTALIYSKSSIESDVVLYISMIVVHSLYNSLDLWLSQNLALLSLSTCIILSIVAVSRRRQLGSSE